MPVNQVITFPDESPSQTIEIIIASDNHFEMEETFTVVISNPSYGMIGDHGSATVSILGKDNTNTYPQAFPRYLNIIKRFSPASNI